MMAMRYLVYGKKEGKNTGIKLGSHWLENWNVCTALLRFNMILQLFAIGVPEAFDLIKSTKGCALANGRVGK